MTGTDTARVVVMRHPQTVGNVAPFLSGRRDVELTQLGKVQRDRAIGALAAWGPDRVVSSPLSRCLGIARGVRELTGCELLVDERVIEIDFGECEGLSSGAARERGWEFPWPVGAGGTSRPCPGGESFEHLLGRAGEVASWLASLEGRTAVVTHGGFTRALLGAVYGSPVNLFWNFTVPNVSSQLFDVAHGRLRLAAFGLTPEELESRSESARKAKKEGK